MNTRNHVLFRIVALGAAALIATAGYAADTIEHASIPFRDVGNIRSWQPIGHDAILIETISDRWVRADFTSPCSDLPFAMSISFVTEPDGPLDQFGSILVNGQRCWFREIHRNVPEPASREGRHDVNLLR